jgi:3-hydroxybutyryl-CoA dehydrogenase
VLDLPLPDASARVAVIGGGLMGHALAVALIASGVATEIFESEASAREGLESRVRATLTEWRGNADAIRNLRIVDRLENVDKSTCLVVEAIPENLQLKQQFFAHAEQVMPNAVLATNSSVFRVGDVSANMQDPSRAIGTHWWNPPHLMPVVEVIQGAATQPRIVEWTMNFLRYCGKTPVQVRKDTPGFIGNRLQHALWREALALVEEGVADAEAVDAVARNTIG